MEEIWFDGKRFTRFGNYWRSSRKFLHRAIWEFHNGPVPRGYHVHHTDGNRDNNTIENLEAVEGRQHLSEHHKGHGRRPDAALAALPAWRMSEEGKRVMRRRGQLNAHYMQATASFVCEHCNKGFVTTNTGANRFCSNSCKSAWRRASGADDVERSCKCCGMAFSVNRYSKAQCCSKSCGRKLWCSSEQGRAHLEGLARRRSGKQ